MAFWLLGLMLLNMLFGILDSVIVGGSTIQVTRLGVALTEAATTVTVDSTSGFPFTGYVWIDDEKIKYNGATATTFTNCSREYGGTEGAIHDLGQKVYGPLSDAFRATAGYNIINTGASVGVIGMGASVWRFFKTALPQMVIWNFSFLKEGVMQYVRALFGIISTVITIIILIQLASAMSGVLQSVFRR